LELYAFGSYGRRDTVSAANYRQANAAANRDFGAIGSNVTPNAGNFVALTPDGFLPLIASDLEDYSIVAGLRGQFAGFRADLSAGRGHNRFDYEVRNSINTSFGTGSQRTFDAGGLRYGQNIFNLDLSASSMQVSPSQSRSPSAPNIAKSSSKFAPAMSSPSP
jgi:iron complex outermembrane receptor protein